MGIVPWRQIAVTIDRVEKGMSRLESIVSTFDYDRVPQYIQLAKEFVRAMRELSNGTPFCNVCSGLTVDLPQGVQQRLEAFNRRNPDYAPSIQHVCHWYLLELRAMDLGLMQERRSVYEPILQMLEIGGDCYEHHGAICIRDAAMIPLVKS